MFIFFALSIFTCSLSALSCMQQGGNQQQQQHNQPQFHISSHLQQKAEQAKANKNVVIQKVNGKKFAFGSDS